MNPTTVTKCLVIQASSLLPEIQDIVKTFAFYDMQEYHRHKFRPTLQLIDQSHSRKNGFDQCCENDTTIEHWTYVTSDETIQLQAVSCHICGEYVESTSLHKYHFHDISGQLCHCPHNPSWEYYEDEEDYEEDYDY
jgi:hypothetical protein